MTARSRAREVVRSEALYFGLILVASAHFVLFFATRNRYYVDLHAYLAGVERLPFQLRALSAWVGAALTAALAPAAPLLHAIPPLATPLGSPSRLSISSPW
jgi:hypothetical protein